MRRIENEYGLTLAEWRAAANLGRDDNDLVSVDKADAAWRAGEDPTEYAYAEAPVAKPRRRANPKRKRNDC